MGTRATQVASAPASQIVFDDSRCLGDTERDYYRLGSAGVSAPRDQADRDAGPGPGGTPGEQRDEDDRRVAEVKWTPDARPGADTGGADQ